VRRKEFLRFGAAVLSGAVATVLSGCGGGEAGIDALAAASPDGLAEASPLRAAPALTADEAAALRFMREEEKLAHDVYTVLHDAWGLQVFANIALSETEHTEAVLGLLLKYGLDDPAAARPVGSFEDPALQALYDRLVAAGRVNAVEGLKVGALIEETDIRDINEKKSFTDNTDILRVYDNLLCGSENHLRAFNEQLLARGVQYVPEVISQAEWDAVATASRTRCGG
jgi:hypothetical protein